MSGIKHDSKKLRLGLWPVRVYLAIGEVLTLGAQKYAPHGWQTVDNFEERYYSALMRHLCAWRLGEMNDPETCLPHLAHACTNAVFLLSKHLGLEGPTQDVQDASQINVEPLDDICTDPVTDDDSPSETFRKLARLGQALTELYRLGVKR